MLILKYLFTKSIEKFKLNFHYLNEKGNNSFKFIFPFTKKESFF